MVLKDREKSKTDCCVSNLVRKKGDRVLISHSEETQRNKNTATSQ